MDMELIIGLASRGLLLALLVSLPAVVASAVIGLVIAFLQAITSVQDAAISQGFKLMLVGVVVLIAAPWGSGVVLEYARTALRAVFA
jgi:type III secretion protein S